MRLAPAEQVVCGYERDSMGSTVGEDARVIQCLQDYRCAAVGVHCFIPQRLLYQTSRFMLLGLHACMRGAGLQGQVLFLLLALLLCHGRNCEGCARSREEATGQRCHAKNFVVQMPE